MDSDSAKRKFTATLRSYLEACPLNLSTCSGGVFRRLTLQQKLPKPVWNPKLVIREIPDAAWARIEPVLEELCPPAPTGRPRTVDFRVVLNAVVFRLRSGCQWNRLPEKFGDDSRVHHGFQTWANQGVFRRLWAVLLEECDERRRRQLDLAIRRRVQEQGPVRRGKKAGRIRRTGAKTEPRKAFWSKAPAVPCRWSSTARTSLKWFPKSVFYNSSRRRIRRQIARTVFETPCKRLFRTPASRDFPRLRRRS